MTKTVVCKRPLLTVVVVLAAASAACTSATPPPSLDSAAVAPAATVVLVEVNDPTGYTRLDFGDLLVERLNSRGPYHAVDARTHRLPFEALKETPASPQAERFRARYPADAYLAASVSRCRALRRIDETNYHTERDKVWHNFLMWAEGECHATVEVVDGVDGHEIVTFQESGYADSAKSPNWEQSVRITTAQEAKRSLAREVAAKLASGVVEPHVDPTPAPD